MATPRRADRQRLQALGLDVTEHADADSVEVLAHGRADLRTLHAAGFRYRVRVADLAAQARATRAATPRPRARPASGCPAAARATGACPTTTSR